MLNSILDDFKNTFRSGNMISRIILVNVAVFIIINLFFVFDFQANIDPNSLAQRIANWLSIHSVPSKLIKQPWALVSHMFLHIGFWHIIWNMLLLYWFGRIVGDLIGDNRILPIYILGGLVGAALFAIHVTLMPEKYPSGSYAYGASAAVMTMVWSAAMISPDYRMNLLFIGPVKLKYISLGLLFMDLVGTSGVVNTGGHFAHIGGALFGMLYVYLLRAGTDLADPFIKLSEFSFFSKDNFQSERKVKKTPRNKFKVVHNTQSNDSESKPGATLDTQSELDRILDKINELGYKKLTAEEKEFLYQASKKK